MAPSSRLKGPDVDMARVAQTGGTVQTQIF